MAGVSASLVWSHCGFVFSARFLESTREVEGKGLDPELLQDLNLGGQMSASMITTSLGLFVLAGLSEIAGGWLVWQWLREGRSWPWGLLGGLILFLYGVIPTFQPAHFGRVYATYGGFFIALSLLWGWVVDGNKPDPFDLIGGTVSLVGVAIIMYWPR